MKRNDLTDQLFGRLTVRGVEKVVKSPTSSAVHVYWRAACACGKFRSVPTYRLKNGTVTACLSCSHPAKKEERVWVFSATACKVAKVADLLTEGAKTCKQLHTSLRGTLDSIMDCLAVLVDQGRITSYILPNDERLYYFKAEANQTNTQREMAPVQVFSSDRTFPETPNIQLPAIYRER